MKILYITNIPSPYMVNFLNELGERSHLTCIFEKAKSDERDESWQKYTFANFKGIILSGLSTAVDMAFCPSIFFYLKKGVYDFIIVANLASPTGILAIEYMKIRGIPFILESEGGFPKSGKGLKERFKKHIIASATFYFSTTKEADKYFLRYGATQSQILRFPFTSIYEKDILDLPLNKFEKSKIKGKYKLKGKTLTVAIGQFIPRKNFGVLLECWRSQKSSNTLCLIGGGFLKENYLSEISRLNLDNVKIIDFIPINQIHEILSASDLLVLPTKEDVWGLVINEAMSKGIPVITTDRCLAGLELIHDFENGFIVSVRDVETLTIRIQQILSDSKLRGKMSVNNLIKIREYTFEKMAEAHISALSDILSK